jgi:FkbM family methyltransferase
MNDNMISPKELEYLKYVKKDNITNGMVVFDVGGNKGHYTAHALSYFKNKIKSIFIFEPVPRFYDIIKSRFDGIDIIETLPFACSDAKTSDSFFEIVNPENEDAEGLSSFNRRDVYDRFNYNEIEVNCIILDDFIKENSIDKVHFIKVDTEGHELSVLKGLKQSLIDGKIGFMQIEYGDCIRERGQDLDEILDLLEDTGYKVYDFCDGGFIEIDKNNWESYKLIAWDNYLITREEL